MKRRVGRRASYTESLGFGGVSVFTSILLAIVTSVAVSRLYGVEQLGRFALATAPSIALSYLSSMQEQVALVRRVALLEPRDPKVTGLFGAVLAFSTGLTLLVGVITLAVSYFLFKGPIGQPDLFVPAVITLAGMALLNNTAWNLDTLLSAFRAGRELFAVRTSQLVAFLIGVFALAPTSLSGLDALIAATLASQAFALLHRSIVVRRFLRIRVPAAELREGFRALPEIIRFGLKLTPRTVASGASSQIGTWLLGVYGSVTAVGAFSRAYQLGTRFMDVSFRVAEVLIPTLAERRHNNDVEGFDRAVVDSLRLCAFGLLLPAAVAGGASVGVMEVFGPGFPAAADALAVLLVAPGLAALSNVQAQVLIAAERPGRASWITVGRSVVTLAASVPLVIEYGALGAAIGWVLGYAVELIVQQRLAARELAVPLRRLWSYRQRIAQVLGYAAGFAAARVIDSAIDGLWGVVPALTAGTLAYAGAFVACGGLAARDRERVRSAWSAARRRVGRSQVQTG